MDPLTLHRATPADRQVLERLWLMFRHDLSEHRGVLPFPDATHRQERLHASLEDPDRSAWLVRPGDRPVGLALVRGVHTPPRVLSGFFVVRGARCQGIGFRALRALLAQHTPGDWEVAHQAENSAAAAFWPSVAERLDPGGWSQAGRPVPGRLDLPPDTWVTSRWGSRGGH